ncbi:MAG TPA: phosphate ABC transporter substrate-binding protein PstS [Bacteroidales bacterium]|nr:phosphate ABC transporter substrate-binding protein PstS [Bacteroidales bacterium]
MKKLIILLVASLVVVSCNNSGSNKTARNRNVTISAAGATFPLPFYNLAFKKYAEATGVTVNYGGIGSGGGIKSLRDKVVDFGATDAFLSDEELVTMSEPVVHIPTCIGGVVLAYNLPGITGLKLTPEIIEGIFLGGITKWNDPKIAAVNKDLSLPDLKITVVYRSDGSGTTYIFSDYMTKAGKLWGEKIGTGKSLNWPVGIAAKGNPGVAGTISQSAGTIGYIGYEFAVAQKIPAAAVANSSGSFIEPNLQSLSAAASIDIPADTRVMLTNSSNPQAYPITSFTWIILYKEQAYGNHSQANAEATVRAVKWLTESDAQSIATSVNYAPLPQKAVEQASKVLSVVTFNGTPILR